MTRLIDSVRTDAAQQRTGLMSYRLAAYRELPRTGLPDIFDGWADYTRYVRVLEKAGAIRDAVLHGWKYRAQGPQPGPG